MMDISKFQAPMNKKQRTSTADSTGKDKERWLSAVQQWIAQVKARIDSYLPLNGRQQS
jgi:hypothetical protein